ncbi:MAG: alpha/beta hydrolase [Burkholderiales bacterium]|jgi:pimeloyl-ACP methyl ester carboxylesterase|nr:alpha/beta hydrolase [Burkholderiales bacterium]
MRSELEYKLVKTKHGQTGYVSLGSGKPLIMLVGYSGNLLHWNSELIYRLAENFTVYLPDNRRVGLSESSNTLSMEGLAQDVIDFIEALELNKPFLCGWSMGGIIAQALAYERADLISGMVLIASQADYSYTMGGLHTLVRNLREHPGRENREKLTELFFSELPNIEFRKYLARSILHIAGYIYPYKEHAQQLQDHAVKNWLQRAEQLEGLNLPVLITTARNDLVTKPEASWYLHTKLTNSKLISYQTGGHFFMHRYAVELADEIISYFQ